MTDRRNEMPRSLRGANPRPREDEPTVEARLPKPDGYQHPPGNVVGIPKRAAPVRSAEYLDFVREHPCCACGIIPMNEAHHYGPRGMGEKASDLYAVPLCTKHHREFHDKGSIGEFLRTVAPSQWAEQRRVRTELGFIQAQRDLLIEWVELQRAK